MKADHMAFEVSDMDKAIAFYSNVLELPLLSRQKDDMHGEEFAFLGIDGCNLELLRDLKRTTPPHQTVNATFSPHFAIGVDDVHGLVARLAEKDLHPIKGPLEISGLVRWVYYADPDNNVIEFVQWLRP